MIRRIIQIDEDKCNGCGACANACHEGAIGMVNGKSKIAARRLLRRTWRLSANLPDRCHYFCGTGSCCLRRKSRKENMKKKAKEEKTPVFSGCPGQRMRQFDRRNSAPAVSADNSLTSELRQWPVQIKLVPTKAPYFDGAKLLIAADCTAYAYANFHHDFIKGKITVVGCPKLVTLITQKN